MLSLFCHFRHLYSIDDGLVTPCSICRPCQYSFFHMGVQRGKGHEIARMKRAWQMQELFVHKAEQVPATAGASCDAFPGPASSEHRRRVLRREAGTVETAWPVRRLSGGTPCVHDVPSEEMRTAYEGREETGTRCRSPIICPERMTVSRE